ncbi:MAG: hypothetical protein ACOZAM_03340 [Pseudomonadota bacterium]
MNEATPSYVPDPEDVEDFLKSLEEAFDIRFVQSDANKLRTVGGLFEVLRLRMGTTSDRRRRCLSAVSFYRLRKAVADATGMAVRPRTAISDVFPAKSPASRVRALGERTGLRLPRVAYASGQSFLFLFGTASCLAAFYFGVTAITGVAALLLGLGASGVLRFVEFRRSMAQQNFGEFARETAFLNYGRLARETGALSDIDLWNALEFMIRKDGLFDGEFDRETRFA